MFGCRIRTFREREVRFCASKRIPNATGGAHGAQGGAHRGGLLCSVGRGDISGRHVFVVDEANHTVYYVWHEVHSVGGFPPPYVLLVFGAEAEVSLLLNFRSQRILLYCIEVLPFWIVPGRCITWEMGGSQFTMTLWMGYGQNTKNDNGNGSHSRFPGFAHIPSTGSW